MEKKIKKYIELIIKIGINIQKGQILVISAPVETFNFTRKVVETAYQNGAKEVIVNWSDEVVGKYKYLYADDEIFDDFPKYQADMMNENAKKGAAFLSIYAVDPEILKDVDSEKVARFQKARSQALKEYYDKMMSNENQWCVVSIPTESWSKKIYPNLSGKEAKEKLWNQIFSIVRVDKEEPIKEWNNHLNNLKEMTDYLNSMKFRKLRYTNSLGTSLEIGLPKGHIWIAGGETSKAGVYFVANMPTEELFTLPKKDEINGIVYSSKPFCYGGNLIEKFYLKFKDGKVIEAKAEKGEEVLNKLLDSDKGARYLGEVALVPYNSPISKADTIFYNTLFDENASCHLALGQAYPTCLEGGSEMNSDELEKNGVNDSLIHEDFMIGTSDLKIVGTTEDGKEIIIMKDGNFVK